MHIIFYKAENTVSVNKFCPFIVTKMQHDDDKSWTEQFLYLQKHEGQN